MLPAHSAVAELLAEDSHARQGRPLFTAARPTRLGSLFGTRFMERNAETPTPCGPGAKPVGGDVHG
jgi:hypothetical protein